MFNKYVVIGLGLFVIAMVFFTNAVFGQGEYSLCHTLLEGICERLDTLITQNDRIIDILEADCKLRDSYGDLVWKDTSQCRFISPPSDIIKTKHGIELIKNLGADRCEFFDYGTNETFYSSCTWWDGYFK